MRRLCSAVINFEATGNIQYNDVISTRAQENKIVIQQQIYASIGKLTVLVHYVQVKNYDFSR